MWVNVENHAARVRNSHRQHTLTTFILVSAKRYTVLSDGSGTAVDAHFVNMFVLCYPHTAVRLGVHRTSSAVLRLPVLHSS